MSARSTRVSRGVGLIVLLGTPVVLAFFAGGYYDQPRLWACLVVWVMVAVAALTSAVPLPLGTPGRLALGGLTLFAAWTALSELWAPLKDVARNDAERELLYVGVLLAAAALLRHRAAVRNAEAGLAAGVFVVVAYGLSERLVPGVLSFHHGLSAGGRLEQPLTYWNAMGILAAIGVVLCARLAGDPSRRLQIAAAAAAAAVPLSLGAFLSFSRGALAALAVGLLVLLALDPRMQQLRAIARVVVLGAIASGVGALLGGVRALEGGPRTREVQGAAMLVVLIVLACVAATATLRSRRVPDERTVLFRHRRVIPALALLLCLATVLVSGAVEHGATGRGPGFGATATRLGSIQSNRYEYWRVAVGSFARHPLIGLGSGGFRVDWLRHRTVADPALNAHSLYIETAAELGIVGLVALLAFLLGVARSVPEALRRAPGVAVGAVAAISAYAVHAGVDWDWQMPAVTIVALVLAGAVIALAEDEPVG